MHEQKRLAEANADPNSWKKFGPYLTERQWGTVREDYSRHGDAWNYVTHDMARAYAYRWGEEGLGGLSDDQQRLCLAVGLWNEADNQLKERLFGLTNGQGNHGEDVKELYYYLDSTPTHSYMRMLYKYPQAAYPYEDLLAENARRTRQEPEYELLDTGIFNENRYFDVFIEYAKAGPDDILLKITAHNRGPEAAPLHVLPQLWFRNTWTLGYDDRRPTLRATAADAVAVEHAELGQFQLYCDQHLPGEEASFSDGRVRPAPTAPLQLLFCDNETQPKLRKAKKTKGHCYKDGINRYVVNRRKKAVNPAQTGTKVAAHYQFLIAPGAAQTVRVRLSQPAHAAPFADFDQVFADRQREADEFYDLVQAAVPEPDARAVQRQAFAGMLWSKQFYYYDVSQWLDGDPARPAPPAERLTGRNATWRHLHNADLISMPDKWEYPWYAAWDLAFHCLPLAMVDTAFAKNQLRLLCQDGYLHPNGQMPAYEWHFSDVNAPVHAWATWRVYQMDRKLYGGEGDNQFLEAVFQKLVMTFTWWVNRKDRDQRNIFEGGFLGMDNIGVFDRSAPLPTGGRIEQSDGTSWMAMFALNLMRMALELAKTNPVYQEMASKFFEHFLYIAYAMTRGGGGELNLWDDQDKFYYDVLHMPDDSRTSLRIRSMVGLIPLFAVEVLDDELLAAVPEFTKRAYWLVQHRPHLAELVSRWVEPNQATRHLLSLMRRSRLRSVLHRMLDETEFLAPHGIRSLSRYHLEHPYEYHTRKARFSVSYVAGEADLDMFGGNSNWRGPIWFPVNYLIIESLQRFHSYYGDSFTVEYPTGSGQQHTLAEIAAGLSKRLAGLLLKDENGRRPAFGDQEKMQSDPLFQDNLLFHEYFDGDTGKGLGASHQTGWTGLVVRLLQWAGN